MISNRKINDLDNFVMFNAPQNMVSPRNQPLAPLNNNYRTVSPRKQMPSPLIADRPHSPNRISNTRKPMISPSRSPRRQPPIQRQNKSKVNMNQQEQYFCSNQSHPNKQAEYFIHVDNEDMYYCKKCAAQAASQGFTINQISKSGNYNQQKKDKVLPYYPEYQNSQKYKELMGLMKMISALDSSFNTMSDPKRVSAHYESQEEMLMNFYEEIATTVQRMRNDHLADLQQEKRLRIKQISDWKVLMQQHTEELNEAWSDIHQNMPSIVEQVDADNFQGCMYEYRKKCQLFAHKIEEFQEESHPTTYYENRLNEKVQIFERKIKQMWEENEQAQPEMITRQRAVSNVNVNKMNHIQRGKTVKRVHSILPQQQQSNQKDAFRNLFPQNQSEQRLPQASPQFKAF